MPVAHDPARIGSTSTPYGYPPFEPYRITVDQYYRMIDAGIFHPEDRVELLDGLVIAKDTPHQCDPSAPDGAGPPIYRFSVDQYHESIDAGILTPDDRTELLNGFLARKMGKNPPHSASLRRARRRLEAILPDGWIIDIQEPITTLTSEPEPDLAIVRGRIESYDDRHPRPDDIGILVEISDSSLRLDQVDKAEIYAEARVPYYWILNIPKRRLEVRSEPSGPGASPHFVRLELFEETMNAPVVLDGVEVARIPVRDLLP